MNTRRSFLRNLAGIFVVAQAPSIFIPKLIEIPRWKPTFQVYQAEIFERIPFYLAKIQIERNPNWIHWQKFPHSIKFTTDINNVVKSSLK